MLKSIDHLNIVVSDLHGAKDFFCRLGFTVAHQGKLAGGWISSIVNLKDVRATYVQLTMPGSAVKIELIHYATPTSPTNESPNVPNKIGIRHIAFEVEDIDNMVAVLKEEGIQFFGDVQIYPDTGKKLVYFHGPDGIILELAQYPSQ